MAGQELHRRRTNNSTLRRVHGCNGGQTAQPYLEGLLRSPSGGRKAQNGRNHRCRAKAFDHPQRHPEGRAAMANRLTKKTVALPKPATMPGFLLLVDGSKAP